MQGATFVFVFIFGQISANIFLEYQPLQGIYYPKPAIYKRQTIPSKVAWYIYPESYQPNYEKPSISYLPPAISDRLNSETIIAQEPFLIEPEIAFLPNEVNTNKETTIKPVLSLEYKPIRPSHASQIGQTLSQIIQPGEPLPDGPKGNGSSQPSTLTKPVTTIENVTNDPEQNLVNRIKESPNSAVTENSLITSTSSLKGSATTALNPQLSSNTSAFIQPDDLQIHDQTNLTNPNQENQSIILEYQPNRPSFLPNPGSQGSQIVPSGQPLPDSPEEYLNFLQTESTSKPTLENRAQSTARTTVISLEYVPSRPPYHPRPGDNIAQIIPPGEPWPDSPEGYSNFSQTTSSPKPTLENRLQSTPKTTVISLEYVPSRPTFHPRPGDDIAQIIPPGKPWPASAENYQNSSQSSKPILEERFKENTTTQAGFVWQDNDSAPLEPRPISAQTSTSTVKIADRLQEVVTETTVTVPNRAQEQTSISLEYKPQLPSHHTKPGQTLITQIIKPGKPWPNSLEGYQNFSQTTAVSLENRLKEADSSLTQIDTDKGTSLDLGVLHTSPPRLRSEVNINSATTLSKEKK